MSESESRQHESEFKPVDYVAAILRYGNHEYECNVNQAWGSGNHVCDCGFAIFTGEPLGSDEQRANYEKRRKAR